MELKLHHIKAHGALYNQMFKDKDLSNFYLDTLNNFKDKCYVYVPFNSEIEKSALKKDLKLCMRYLVIEDTMMIYL